MYYFGSVSLCTSSRTVKMTLEPRPFLEHAGSFVFPASRGSPWSVVQRHLCAQLVPPSNRTDAFSGLQLIFIQIYQVYQLSTNASMPSSSSQGQIFTISWIYHWNFQCSQLLPWQTFGINLLPAHSHRFLEPTSSCQPLDEFLDRDLPYRRIVDVGRQCRMNRVIDHPRYNSPHPLGGMSHSKHFILMISDHV